MVVVTLTDCPPKLRGDLSKWLMEINTGVYVGQVNSRVRDALWKRICDNLAKGRATMVYSANNEQRMEFRVHNTTWEPVDFEGLKLMRRPLSVTAETAVPAAPSKAAVAQMTRRSKAAQARRDNRTGYVVVDIETTGLDSEKDEIIELAALRVVDHKVTETFSSLLRIKNPLPAEISALTGIRQEELLSEGKPPEEALEAFWSFVGQSPVVGHNLGFDQAFLRRASAAAGISTPRVTLVDTLTLARRRVRDVPDHRLATLAEYFELEPEGSHRALADCHTTFRVYEKLNEI